MGGEGGSVIGSVGHSSISSIGNMPTRDIALLYPGHGEAGGGAEVEAEAEGARRRQAPCDNARTSRNQSIVQLFKWIMYKGGKGGNASP